MNPTMETFQAAANWLSSAPTAAHLPNEEKLEIYGLYKYITENANGPTSSRPTIFYPGPRAKYDAWVSQASKCQKFGDQGPQQARSRYIEIASKIGWEGEGLGEDEEIDFESDSPPSPRSKGKARDTEVMGARVSILCPTGPDDGSPGHPIHDAVAANSPSDVEAIIQSDPQARDARDSYGNTPLHLATDRGYIQIVRLLVNAGADRNALDDDQQTPLMIAAALGRDELADILQPRH